MEVSFVHSEARPPVESVFADTEPQRLRKLIRERTQQQNPEIIQFTLAEAVRLKHIRRNQGGLLK